MRTFALAAAVTAPAIATADEVPPPPEVRYAQTNREAERRGREILEQARFMARAADLLKEYAAPEPWSSNAGWIVAQRQTPVARFIVEDTSGALRVLYDVTFERDGRSVPKLSKYDTPAQLSETESRMFRARRSARVVAHGDVTTVVVPDRPRPGWAVYVLSSTAPSREVTTHEYQRIQTTEDGAASFGMFALGWGRVSATEDPRFENALGFALTSPKASTPNELHVYLSLTQPLPLFITTDSGVWIVKSGTIAFGQPAPTSEEP